MSDLHKYAVFIDPSSEHFLQDRLFDHSNKFLNRDGTLLPFVRLRDALKRRGIPLHTADRLIDGSVTAESNYYWSLGITSNYSFLSKRDDVRLRGFLLLEPPLVSPRMYKALPSLSRAFDAVYLHNTLGDGYDLKGVVQDRLAKLYWPQPYNSEVPEYWTRVDRLNKLVVIAGLHNPILRKPEFYSCRLDAIGAIHSLDGIDLYGRGWSKWWSLQAQTTAFWQNFVAIRESFRGPCENKLSVLSNYRFSLCFENMPMQGYVTEKIFDCLYAGTVPVYLGAPDIDKIIPPEVYVDMRDFGKDGYVEMWNKISQMPREQWESYRSAGREFLRGIGKNKYYDSLLNMIESDF